jgi:hypothetical protein
MRICTLRRVQQQKLVLKLLIHLAFPSPKFNCSNFLTLSRCRPYNKSPRLRPRRSAGPWPARSRKLRRSCRAVATTWPLTDDCTFATLHRRAGWSRVLVALPREAATLPRNRCAGRQSFSRQLQMRRIPAPSRRLPGRQAVYGHAVPVRYRAGNSGSRMRCGQVFLPLCASRGSQAP